MKKVFISGPMTGIKDFNYPAFNKAAAELHAMGYEVHNPADNPKCESWEEYMRLALRQLALCDEVAQLPGWQKSRGASVEHSTAMILGMHIWEMDKGDAWKKHDLPLYDCHKQVRAGKITRIDRSACGVRYEIHMDATSVVVDSDFVSKHKPIEGGYYVEYEDGYRSYSPAKAFEEGYSLALTGTSLAESPDHADLRKFVDDMQWDAQQIAGIAKSIKDGAGTIVKINKINLDALPVTTEEEEAMLEMVRRQNSDPGFGGVDIDVIHKQFEDVVTTGTGVVPISVDDAGTVQTKSVQDTSWHELQKTFSPSDDANPGKRAPWPFPVGLGKVGK